MRNLILEKQGPTLFITINRPDVRNAMSLQMVAELSTIFSEIENDTSIRAAVIRGAGGHFCAGGDIKDMAGARSQKAGEGRDDPFYKLNRAFGQMIQQVNESSKVVIAITEGAVMGGGFGLACVSDLAIAGPTAKFGMPETTLGVIPAQIAPFVVERIGLTQARRLALLGLRIDATEACTLGIVHQVAESEEQLSDMLNQALERVRLCAPDATAETKALLHRVGHEAMAGLLDDAAEKFAPPSGGRRVWKALWRSCKSVSQSGQATTANQQPQAADRLQSMSAGTNKVSGSAAGGRASGKCRRPWMAGEKRTWMCL